MRLILHVGAVLGVQKLSYHLPVWNILESHLLHTLTRARTLRNAWSCYLHVAYLDAKNVVLKPKIMLASSCKPCAAIDAKHDGILGITQQKPPPEGFATKISRGIFTSQGLSTRCHVCWDPGWRGSVEAACEASSAPICPLRSGHQKQQRVPHKASSLFPHRTHTTAATTTTAPQQLRFLDLMPIPCIYYALCSLFNICTL